MDRGSWSVEIILSLLALKCLYPQARDSGAALLALCLQWVCGPGRHGARWTAARHAVVADVRCLPPPCLQHVHLTRGNHEAKSMNTIYGEGLGWAADGPLFATHASD